MRKDQLRRHDAHVRVNDVCTQHSALFDATAGGQSTRGALDTLVTTTTGQLAVQKQSLDDRRAATAQCRVARRALHTATRAVVRVGQLVTLDQTTMDTMQIPRTMGDDELMAHAQGLLNRVTPYTDAFVAKGLPPDIMNRLGTGIQALAKARTARAAAIRDYAAATASIRETQDVADKTVAALDAIAIALPAANPEVVTKLRMAKRVGPRVAPRVVDTAPKPTPEPTPEPTPAPAPTPPPAPSSTTPSDKTA